MKRLLLFCLALFSIYNVTFAQSVIIGTGTTNSNGTIADPVDRFYNYRHMQIVYLASELSAGGMTGGAQITALGFSISESAVSLANYTIQMGHTGQTLANPYISSGLATVKSAFTYAPVVQTAGNFDMITFSSNFTWNGTDNIVIDICTGSNPYTTPYGGLRYTAGTSGAMRGISTDGSSNCGTATSTNYAYRPNIQLNYTAGSACSGTPDPGNTLSSANPVCPGTNFTLSLQNSTPGTGVTYQWQSSPNGADPWTNIGTSTPTHTTSQTAATYYRCQVTCGTKTGTSNPILQGDPAPPTTQASAITTSALAYTTATITWTAGSGNRRYAVLNNVNSFTNPSGTGDVTVAGTGYSGSGEQIIYDGTGTSVSVTGLIANTTYYVRVYEYLRCTGTPNTNYYQTSTATNNPGSFTTLAFPTCPGGLGTGTVNIPSLPYSATALTNCGNGNNITSTNVASVCGSSNYYTGEDKTFIFTPSSSGDYVFTLTSITTYTAMMLYNGCPFSASCVGNVQSSGSGTKTMTLSLTSGTTYYLVVDTWTAPTCIPSFDLSIAAATPPSCTTITTPADGATNVALAGNITFAAATGATSYDIYLSTSTPPAYHGNTTTTTYAYTGLSANTLYYVQIIPKNANGAASGCTITSFTTVPPPPANDNCAGATAFPTIPTDGTCASLSNQSTAGATQSQVACAGSGADDDVWFSFVAPATTIITEITAVSGSSDRVHEIFSGTCGALVSIKCSDPETSTTTGLTIGATYYIRVHTYYSGDFSVFNICLKTPPAPPANDNCAGATAFPTIPTDGTCASLSNQSTAGATQSQVACAGSGADDDVWFSFVAPATSIITEITAVSGSSDRVHEIFSGTCGALVSIKCSDPETSTTTGLTIGATYYIRVHTYSTGTFSVFNICLKTPPALPDCATLNTPLNAATNVTLTTSLTWTPAATGGTPSSYKVYHGTANPPTTFYTVTAPTTTYTPSGRAYSTTYYWYVVPTNATGDAVGCNGTIFSYTTAAPPPPPANDNPAGAINVDQILTSSCGSPLTGQTTESATETLADDCSDATNAYDVWYKFIAQTPNLTVNATTSTDIVLVVYLGDPTNGGTIFDCDDNFGGGETVSLIGLDVGKTYYYRVFPYYTGEVASFSTCVYGPAPASISLGTANTCVNARSILSTGSGKWLYITNTDGGVVAALKDDNVLGNVATSFYINSGAVRTSGGIPYLDRNVEITPAVTNLGATIRLYYTQAELDALNVVANPDLTLATMQGYKTSETCSGTQGSGTSLTQSGNGTGSGGNYVEYTIPGFSSFFPQQAATLPLELLSFNGYADKTANVLNWKTANETNTDKFEVERSVDGKNWDYLTDVKAGGDSREKLNYSASDNNPMSTSYYRLKMLDRDGRYTFSNAIIIERNDRSFKLYSVSPNPNRGDFTVTFNTPSNGENKMILVNSLGMKVHSQVVNAKAGTNAEYLNATGLANGIYTLLIEQDGQIITQRVVINK